MTDKQDKEVALTVQVYQTSAWTAKYAINIGMLCGAHFISEALINRVTVVTYIDV